MFRLQLSQLIVPLSVLKYVLHHEIVHAYFLLIVLKGSGSRQNEQQASAVCLN